MTKKSNDEHREELNIRRGHLAQDSEPIDDDVINEDLHNVIAAYWENRQKPGFVGYKNNQEDEEEEVRVENDVDISFLKNPRRTQTHPRPDTDTSTEEKPDNNTEEPAETKEIVMDTEPVNTSTDHSDATTSIPPVFKISPEKMAEARELAENVKEPAGARESAEATKKSTENASNVKAVPEKTSDPAPEKTENSTSVRTDNKQKPDTKTLVRKKKRKKKKKGPGRIFKWIFIFLLLFVVGGTVTFGVMRYIGWKNSNRTNDSGENISTPDGVISEDGGKTVVYKGVTYVYNEELSTILFIGVDKEKYEENGVSGDAGQADTVILTVVNQKTGETRMIPLSRSTMVAIDQYNTDGSYWKQDILQLAVSFAYGDNIDENCKNVAKAVSRILYGMPVHKYVTMDLTAIPQLNDAVGGVAVTCLEDMTDVDESWTEGAEITLHGKQAETYVRHRKTTISDEKQDNNAPRMERQKQYLNSFIRTLLSRMKGDIFVPLRLYRDVGDDIHSDVTTAEIVYYTSMVVSKGFNNSILSIKGSVKHNEYTEFYPDQEELYQLILDTFYERQ